MKNEVRLPCAKRIKPNGEAKRAEPAQRDHPPLTVLPGAVGPKKSPGDEERSSTALRVSASNPMAKPNTQSPRSGIIPRTALPILAAQFDQFRLNVRVPPKPISGQTSPSAAGFHLAKDRKGRGTHSYSMLLRLLKTQKVE
jgi:hypothetical protein